MARTDPTDRRWAAEFTIESFISDEDGIGGDLVVEAASAAHAAHTTDFEDVGEVGGDGDADGNAQWGQAVVDDAKFLMCDITPEKSRAHEVESAARNHDVP